MCSLIASPRFRPGDLERWRSLEMADRLYAQRYAARLDRLTEAAITKMEKFCQEGAARIDISWGKDSVVVAHLAYRSNLALPIAWVKVERRFNPDCLPVRDAFLAQHCMQYLEVAAPPGRDGQTSQPGFVEIGKQLECDRYISGIRKEESKQRELRGSKNTAKTCAPIADWTTKDVFAYLCKYDLPIHPAYAMSNGGQFERQHLRVASIGGRRGTQFSRRAWEELYYRDILQSIYERNPPA